MAEDSRKAVDRLVKLFVLPTAIIVLILLFIFPSFQRAGILYLAAASLTLVIYKTVILPGRKRKGEVIGVKKNLLTGGAYGLLLSGGFIFLSWVSPAFTIGVPPVPASAADQIKGFIVIILAPIMEESLFRGALLSLFLNYYGMPFWQANLLQGGLFSGTHLLAYGVFLEQLDKLTEVFGQVAAISGLFIAAFVFAVIAGIIVHKWKNLFTTIIGHGGINTWVFTFVLGLVTFG